MKNSERNTENRNAKKSPLSNREGNLNNYNYQEDLKSKNEKMKKTTSENKSNEFSNSNINVNKVFYKYKYIKTNLLLESCKENNA